MSAHDDSKELLLTHVSYIREACDRIETKVNENVERTSDHEIRIVRLEVAPRAEKSNDRWTRLFTALGAFVAGLFGGRLT